ncbi:uncharacterized protein LOC120218927 [Hibiscus syriacus]|uniref:uncharacterized protein LOC120218927 n=1 Tax=Hibiscus syriacus TaxID=106335 RepID=UPI001920672D|nr:uncharacterized protein LOC120218927 [Hibiscus syriacus]
MTKFLREEIECSTNEVEQLRDGTTRSEEERGLMLSGRRQPPSFTRQIPTDLHIIGTNSESFDKDRRGSNFETFDKFSSMEHAAFHSISSCCANGTDILMKLEIDDESKVKLSDFADLGGERIPIGKYSFPPSLHQIVQNITEVYGDVSAATSRMNLSIADGIYIMFCASIKEMNHLRLEQVTEDMILKWRDAIKDFQGFCNGTFEESCTRLYWLNGAPKAGLYSFQVIQFGGSIE